MIEFPYNASPDLEDLPVKASVDQILAPKIKVRYESMQTKNCGAIGSVFAAFNSIRVGYGDALEPRRLKPRSSLLTCVASSTARLPVIPFIGGSS